MLKSERRKIAQGRIWPILKARGYKRGGTEAVRYYLNRDGLTISWVIVFLNLGWIQSQGVRIGINEVEDILWGGGLIDENYPRSRDIEKGIALNPTIVDRDFVDVYNTADMDTEEQILEFCDWYLSYIDGAGAEFIKQYSYLPNVLRKMDELVEDGLTWQYPGKGILQGSIDAFFRGLIISQLCNDPNITSKLQFCDKFLYDGTNDDWLPYYEKLKRDILPRIEPKYNL